MLKRIFLFTLLLMAVPVWAQTDDADVIEFGLISDTHRYGTSEDVRFAEENIETFVNYCNNHHSIQFAVHSGDLINSYNTNHESAIWCMEQARADFKDIQMPIYFAKGNHDCNGKQKITLPSGKRVNDNSQIITDREYFDLFSPISKKNPLAVPDGIHVNPEDSTGNYFYRDFEDVHFRLIILNNYDRNYMETFGYHGKQMKWLAEKALNFEDKEDGTQWCFLIIGHAFSYNMRNYPIIRLLHAYYMGEDFADSDNGEEYHMPYHRMRRAQIVGFIGGHFHEDMYQSPGGYNMISVNRGFATGGEITGDPLCFDHYILNTRTKVLEERRIGRGRTRVYTYGKKSDLISPERAFAGAEGMGEFTAAGKNGCIYHVTNLKDKGEGSLRWAVEQNGPRTILFDVSGEIELKTPLIIENDSITIAGQSAPGMGITIKGNFIKIKASEVVMRFLRIRPGDTTKGLTAAVDAISDDHFGQHNIVLDHLSVSWSSGSCIAIRYTESATVQHCMLTHTLHKDVSGNSDGLLIDEDCGTTDPPGLVAGGFMSTYYRNLIANHRNAVHIPDEEGQNRWIHFDRNLIYNWGDKAIYGGNRQGEASIEQNYFKPGPATDRDNLYYLDTAHDGTGRYYLAYNIMEGFESLYWDRQRFTIDRPGIPYTPTEIDSAKWAQMSPVARPIDVGYAPSCISIAAFHYRPIFSNGATAGQIYRMTLVEAGANLHRDSYDQNVVAQLRKGASYGGLTGLISNPQEVGGWPKIPVAHRKISDRNINEELDKLAKQPRTITLLYEGEPLGNLEGYKYLAGYRDALSTDTTCVGLIGLGDFMSGGLLASISHGQYIVDIMRYAQFDAVCLGNHEFIYKIDYLKNALGRLGNIVTCSNLRNVKTKQNVFPSYIMKRYDNTNVAFVGITSPSSFRSYYTSFLDQKDQPKYDLSDNEGCIKLVQQSVDKARADGANYVILLSHLGAGANGELSTHDVVAHTTGIDIALDTHDDGMGENRTIENKEGKVVYYSRVANKMNQLGELTIGTDGVISTSLKPMSSFRFKSTAVTNMIDSLENIFSSYANLNIGSTDQTLINNPKNKSQNPRIRETNLCNLMSDAMRLVFHTDIALLNGGAIRDSIPKGIISQGRIMLVAPYDNKIKIIKISGKQLHQLLDIMSKKTPEERGYLLHPSGMRYTINAGVNAYGIEVLNSKTHRYEPLRESSTYVLAVSDFCMKDPFYGNVLLECEQIQTSIMNYGECLTNYIQNHLGGHVSQEYAIPQGRLKFKGK